MPRATITVFGGSGFIGRHLIRRLAGAGWRVRVPCRSPQSAIHLKPMGDVGQIVLEKRDLRQDAKLAECVVGSRAAVNLIGILHESGRASFEAVQGELPGRIARAANDAGIERVVHISAIGADPHSPSAYARSKALGEANLLAAFPQATVLRPSVVFGPEDAFFNRFAALARFAPALPLIGGGNTRFQPVFVGDVAAAIVAALERDDARGRVYELGGPRVLTFREVLEYILRETGRRRFLVDLPFGVAKFQGRLAEFLPEPPLTRDQVELLKTDNVVAPDAHTLGELGISPTPIEAVVPDQLRRYASPAKRLLSRRPA